MKKALLYSITLCAVVLGLTACNDDNDTLTDSVLTTYANFDIQGDEFVEVALGSSYVDAGCKATLEGQDITSQIVTTGEVDPNTAGFYYINYAYTNKDGYTTSATRTVAVFDPTIETDLTGDYLTVNGSYCQILSSGGVIPLVGMSIHVEQVLPGLFNVSDLIGGLYDQYVGYGSDYAMEGIIQLTADNEIIPLSGEVPGWGNTFDAAYSGTYDPETHQVSWAVDYVGSYYIKVIITPEEEEEEE